MKNTMFQLLCGLAMLSMATVAMAQDDHGDTKDDATVITVNAEATAGKIDPDTDSDWFSFSANATSSSQARPRTTPLPAMISG